MAQRGRPKKQENSMKISHPDKIFVDKNINELDSPDMVIDNIEVQDILLSVELINLEDLSGANTKLPRNHNNVGTEPYKFLNYIARELSKMKILNNAHDKCYHAILSQYGNEVITNNEVNINMFDSCNEYDCIIVDVDPHSGNYEQKVFDKLQENGFNGFVIYDDTVLNEGMKNFWNSIPEDMKVDVTKYAHWSGTGIVNFNKSMKFVCE